MLLGVVGEVLGGQFETHNPKIGVVRTKALMRLKVFDILGNRQYSQRLSTILLTKHESTLLTQLSSTENLNMVA